MQAKAEQARRQAVALGEAGETAAIGKLLDLSRHAQPAVRPDFYLPRYDVYIEYWGLDTTDYKIGMLKKQKLYQQEGKRLISLSFKEKDRLEDELRAKLEMYSHLSDVGAAE